MCSIKEDIQMANNHVMVLNLINHHNNAEQNHNRISLSAHHKGLKEAAGISYDRISLTECIDWYSHSGQHFDGLPKLNPHIPQDPAFPSLVCNIHRCIDKLTKRHAYGGSFKHSLKYLNPETSQVGSNSKRMNELWNSQNIAWQ